AKLGVELDLDAAEQLVADLSRMRVQTVDGLMVEKSGPYVEPMHLQVVCDRLWTRDRSDPKRITLADLRRSGALGHVDETDLALAEYYAESVRRCAHETGVPEHRIRRFFEFDLITEHGFRGQVLLGSEQATRLPRLAYDALVDAHLIRAEPRGGRIWYELAHDRLMDPVRSSNRAWFAENLRPFQRQAPIWVRQGRLSSLLLRGQQWADDAAWILDHADELTP